MSDQKYISVFFQYHVNRRFNSRQVSSPACSARLSGQKIYHSPTAMSPYCEIIIPPSKNPSRRFLQSGSLDARIRKSPKIYWEILCPFIF